MLITDIDEYTNGWNQFDICSRLQNKEGRKSQLLTLAMSSVQNWSDTEKKGNKCLQCNSCIHQKTKTGS